MGFDPGVSRGVHGRGLDHRVSAKQRAVKGAGQVEGEKQSVFYMLEVTKVSIKRFDDEARCSRMSRFQVVNN